MPRRPPTRRCASWPCTRWPTARASSTSKRSRRSASPTPRVYAGRELHASLEADEDGEHTQLELADPVLGLVGKVDALRRRDGSLLPYEHKRGRSRREGKAAAAWPSDRLQVIAYAVLIESATGQSVPEGRVRYHADNVTVRVPIDAEARADLAETSRDGPATPRDDRAAARRRERTTLCPLLAGPRLPARGGPPGR